MHEQVWVKVNTTVDCGIAEIVSLLNEIHGLRTTASCQGDPGGGPAYVYFQTKDWEAAGHLLFDELLPELAPICEDFSLAVETYAGAPIGKLTFRAEATPMVTSALQRVLTSARSCECSGDTEHTALHS
jgi:hypothetical protein